MPDFTVRSDAVNVEQIMEQIRARIREKRGADYTEQQIQELAAVKLEKFLDPAGVRSDLLEQYKRARGPYTPPELPNYAFEDQTLFDSHRGLLRLIRRLLNPILKLFFNPNPLIQALNIQARLNAMSAEREAKREATRYVYDQLNYEVIHNLVTETTRLGIEVKNLKMRVESLTSRLEFNERRARALESAVVYKAPDARGEPIPVQQDRRADDIPVQAREVSRPEPPRPDANRPDAVRPPSPVAPPEGPGQRSRRRRRRRGRRGTGSVAALMGAQANPPLAAEGALSSEPAEPEASPSLDHNEPESDGYADSDAGDAEPSDQEQ